jgi:hypothetical protein
MQTYVTSLSEVQTYSSSLREVGYQNRLIYGLCGSTRILCPVADCGTSSVEPSDCFISRVRVCMVSAMFLTRNPATRIKKMGVMPLKSDCPH